jgi:hypothetical protein
MKRSLAAAWFLILVPTLLCAGAARGDDEEARRHTEKAGGFSFSPPANWTVREFPGLKYKVVVGPVRASFASNINVVDEPFKGTLDDYVKANIGAMRMRFKKFKLEDQGDFKTTSGLRGARLVTESEQGGRLLRQTFYIFGTADTKYVVTCSTLAEGGKTLDPLFERSMKTFRFEKP